MRRNRKSPAPPLFDLDNLQSLGVQAEIGSHGGGGLPPPPCAFLLIAAALPQVKSLLSNASLLQEYEENSSCSSVDCAKISSHGTVSPPLPGLSSDLPSIAPAAHLHRRELRVFPRACRERSATGVWPALDCCGFVMCVEWMSALLLRGGRGVAERRKRRYTLSTVSTRPDLPVAVKRCERWY
jgi:hypothetical protein